VLKIFRPVSGSILIDIVYSPLFEYRCSANYRESFVRGALVGKGLSCFGRHLSYILRTAGSQDYGKNPWTLPYRVPNIYRSATARCGLSEEAVYSRRTDTKGRNATMLSNEDYQEAV
jgi:hypothetical protein